MSRFLGSGSALIKESWTYGSGLDVLVTGARSNMNTYLLAFYLAFKEIWRNRGRFFLVSLVIALITLLVLFIAALGEGLGNGNREYISKLDGQLLVYHAKSDYLIQASRLGTDLVDTI